MHPMYIKAKTEEGYPILNYSDTNDAIYPCTNNVVHTAIFRALVKTPDDFYKYCHYDDTSTNPIGDFITNTRYIPKNNTEKLLQDWIDTADVKKINDSISAEEINSLMKAIIFRIDQQHIHPNFIPESITLTECIVNHFFCFNDITIFGLKLNYLECLDADKTLRLSMLQDYIQLYLNPQHKINWLKYCQAPAPLLGKIEQKDGYYQAWLHVDFYAQGAPSKNPMIIPFIKFDTKNMDDILSLLHPKLSIGFSIDASTFFWDTEKLSFTEIYEIIKSNVTKRFEWCLKQV